MGSTVTGLQRAGVDARELWRHVVACALLADATARGGVSGSAAFTAGLLHDLGRLAMAHQMPARYAEVVRLTQEGLETPWAEARVLGLDHMEAGVAVAQAWQIPDEVVQAIADHHRGEAGALGWLTVNARRIAWSLGIGDGILCPGEPSFDALSEDGEVLRSFGGPERFVETVDWYCDVLTPEGRAA
jgi:putative nucleotidyltransferase with HDIG domain